jgi:hypothetical protein
LGNLLPSLKLINRAKAFGVSSSFSILRFLFRAAPNSVVKIPFDFADFATGSGLAIVVGGRSTLEYERLESKRHVVRGVYT